MDLAEALEQCTPETRDIVSLELRFARAIRIGWAWANKHKATPPHPVKLKDGWLVSVPGYVLKRGPKESGYVMRDFVGNNPTQVFIEAMDQLVSEDRTLVDLPLRRLSSPTPSRR